MGQKRARMLAAVAIAASVCGAGWAAVVFPPTRHSGNLVWYIAPMLLSAAVFVAVGRRSLSGVWVPVGGALGLVVLGAWSVGIFFAPAALILIAGGVVGPIAADNIRPSRGIRFRKPGAHVRLN